MENIYRGHCSSYIIIKNNNKYLINFKCCTLGRDCRVDERFSSINPFKHYTLERSLMNIWKVGHKYYLSTSEFGKVKCKNFIYAW
jgi:hypothetical protein